jgi:hypothetical protein
LKVALLERKTLPLLFVRVDPKDAPRGLATCVANVLLHELVRPLGSTEPMAVTIEPCSAPP